MASAGGRKRGTINYDDDYATKRSRSDNERVRHNSSRKISGRSRHTSTSSSRSNPSYDICVSTRRPLHENTPDDTVQSDSTRRLLPSSSSTALSSSSLTPIDTNLSSTSSHVSNHRYFTRNNPINSPTINDLFELDDDYSDTNNHSDIFITGTTTMGTSGSSDPLDNLFTVDLSIDMPEPPQTRRPSVTVGVYASNTDGSQTMDTHSQQEEDIDVIVVESDDDVIVTRETVLSEDEQLARRLQAQFDHENIVGRETFGTIISTRSMTSEEPGESSSDERSNNIVHDNMEALATRIDNWSVADAARFLMVTMPSGHRGSTGLTRHMIERHFSRTNPMFLYAAVMGGPATIPPGVSSMGSYEDLLSIAEQLGPARSIGLSDKDIKAIKRKRFKTSDSSSDNSSNQSCVVCMSEFVVNELIKRLDPCKHNFHSSCIDPWLKNHKTCPMCRAEVTVPSS